MCEDVVDEQQALFSLLSEDVVSQAWQLYGFAGCRLLCGIGDSGVIEDLGTYNYRLKPRLSILCLYLLYNVLIYICICSIRA